MESIQDGLGFLGVPVSAPFFGPQSKCRSKTATEPRLQVSPYFHEDEGNSLKFLYTKADVANGECVGCL